MTKNQTTYSLKIEAELGSLNKDLETAQSKLQGLLASENAPKGLEKAFEKLKNLLGQVQDKASKPLTGAGFKSVKLDLDKVQEGLSSINRLVGDFSDLADDVKITFLSDDEKRKVEEATKAMEKYLQLVAAANAKEKDLKSANKTKEKAKTRLEKAETSITSLETKKAKKSASIEGKEGQIAALQGMDKVNPEKIAKLQGEIAELKAEVGGLDAELKAAYTELENAEGAFNEASNVVNVLSGNIKNIQTQQLKELKEQAERLGISLDGIKGKKTATQIELLTQAIEEQKKSIIAGAEQGFEQYKKSMQEAGEGARNLSGQVDSSTEALKRQEEVIAQKEAFEAKIKQFLGLSGAAHVLRSALRDALSTITELDATMTEMAVVTDLTVGDYWDQLPEYSARASELGVSINSAYKAATLYYQQGLKTNEVTAISAETLKLAKVAGIDAAEATDKMTAALRGFNMELNDTSAQRVADVYSELAAITAADVNEISSAMTKTASIASSAGMEFETTAAFLSQIIETTRESAETAGTALKTVIARFQELKKDPAEIGEVDGEIVDANKIETALRSVGVALRDSEGQFRKLDDVFLELSSKWNTLDTNTQRYIATIAAGSRQQSRFIAMMQDYGRTQELVSAANNSAGASNRQFEKTMDSLEAKVEKLKNAWHEFTMGIMNSDLVKFGVDVLTKFLEVVNKATGALGGLGGSLTKIASILAIFKLGKKIFDSLKQPLYNMFSSIVIDSEKYGYEAGKNFASGVNRAMQENKQQAEQQNQSEEQTKEQPKQQQSEEQKKQHGIIGRAIGLEGFDKASSAQKKQKEAADKLGGKERRKVYGEKKRAVKDAKATYDRAKWLGAEEIEGAREELKAANQELQEYKKAQNEYLEAGKEKWAGIGEAISKVGSTVTNVGIGVSMLGGIFSSLGLEEVGEGFATVGNWITVVGTGLTVLGPIVAGLGKIISLWGKKCSLAWLWVTLIVAVIAVIVTGLILMFNAMKKNSPEGQLKKAEEYAQKAAEAADQAKEAYEGLSSALDSLDDKYKNLETLTKGAEEYRQAVEELNNDVMDMIAQYPELASFMKPDSDGVMRIDINSDEVQKVLNDYKTASIKTQALSTAANAEVAQKQVRVSADKMGVDYDEINWSGVDFNKIEEIYNKLKAETDLSAEELNSLSRAIQQSEKKVDASFKAMAVSASQLADTLGWSDKDIAMANRTSTNGEMVETIYENIKDTLSDVSFLEDDGGSTEVPEEYRQNLNDAITAAYGEGAVYNYEDGNGEILKNGQVVATLDNDQITNLIANNMATEKAKTAYEYAKPANDTLINSYIDEGLNDEMAALLSGNLGEITASGFKDLNKKLNAKDLKEAWDDLGPVLQQAYGGSFEIFEKTLMGFGDEFDAEVERVTKSTEELLGTEGLGGLGEKISVQGQDIMNTVLTSLTESARGDFVTQLSEVSNLFTDDLAKNDEIIKKIAQTDTTNIEEIDFLIRDLATSSGTSVEALKDLRDTLIEGSGAVSTFLTEVRKFGELYKLTTRTQAIINNLEKSYENYNELLATGNYDQATQQLQNFFNEAGQLTGNLVNGEWTGTLSKTVDAAASDIATLLAGGQQVQIGDLGYASDFIKQNEDGTYAIDTEHKNIDLLNKMTVSGTESEKEAVEALEKRVEDLNDKVAVIKSTEEDAKKTLESLKDLEEESKDSYNKVWDTVKDVLTEQYQKQIEVQQEASDITTDLNNQMIGIMQEQLNEQRRARELQEKKDALTDLYSQQAYLGMDTSGANELAMIQAQEQIKQQEQSLIDASIDQKLEKIGLDNEKAAEQRERQISIQEAQLQTFLESSAFNEQIKNNVDTLLTSEDWKTTNIGQAVIDSWSNAEMPENQKTALTDSFTSAINSATTFTNFFGEGGAGKELITQYQAFLFDQENSIGDKIDAVTSAIGEEALNKARGTAESQVAELQKMGYNVSAFARDESGKLTQEGITQVTNTKKWSEQQGNTNSNNKKTYDSIANQLTQVKNAGGGADLSIQSEAEYRSAMSEKIAKGEKVETYQDYLSKQSTKVSQERASIIQNVLNNVSNSTSLDTAKKEFKKLVDLNANETEINKFLDKLKITDTKVGSVSFAEAGGSWVELRGTIGNTTLGDNGYVINTADQTDITKGLGGHSSGDVFFDGNGKLRAARANVWNGDYNDLIVPAYSNTTLPDLERSAKKTLLGYKTGGLADFTGPAWLDGTPSKPEYILNADQTERFFSLVDVLEGINTKEDGKKSSGDNYFDISINVDKLENDYDVEQVADKIRRMIYEDASYRNVNALNLIR